MLATVALHPNEAPRLADLDEALREIEALAARDRVRGVGETGMDFFRTGDEGRAAQEESFRAHIAIAKRYGKALVIHDRDAHADVLRVLDDEGAPDTVVLHCFSGDADFAARVRPPGLPAQLRRHGHLRQRHRAARGRRAHPARPAAGGDRRAVPDPDAAPGPAERART